MIHPFSIQSLIEDFIALKKKISETPITDPHWPLLIARYLTLRKQIDSFLQLDL